MFRCKVDGCYWQDLGLMQSLKGLAILQIIKSINSLKKDGQHEVVAKILENIDTHSYFGLYPVNVLFKRVQKNNKFYFYYKVKSRLLLRDLKKYLQSKMDFDFILTESITPFFCYYHDKRPISVPSESPIHLFSRQKVGKEMFKGGSFNKICKENGLLMWFPRFETDLYLKSIGKTKKHKLHVFEKEDAIVEVCDINFEEIFYNEMFIVPWEIINMS